MRGKWRFRQVPPWTISSGRHLQLSPCPGSRPGQKPVLFVRFYTKMIILPRQARNKHRENSTKTTVVLQCESSRACTAAAECKGCYRCEQRHFLRHLYIKCIFLPRQARDKHGENSKKSGVFRRRCDRCAAAWRGPRAPTVRLPGAPGARGGGDANISGTAGRSRSGSLQGDKTVLFSPLYR